jgi:drug/metabolite transporter (DMT)-like permease
MSARGWAAFAAMSAIWGVPYLFIKVAVDDGLSPAFVSWVRVLIAAAVLLTLAHRAGALGSLRGRWRPIALYAVVEIALPFPLIAAGEQRVASSVAAIVIACVPLLVALIALRIDPSERPTGLRLAGLLVGLAGVVVLVGVDVAGSTAELVGVILIGLAAAGYAVGPMVLKARLGDLDPRAAMGASLALATLILTPFALAAPPDEVPPVDSIVALAVLGLVCTALAFVVFSVLIVEVGPSRALVITYINPVVAVALGIAVLGERPGAGAVAGLLLILAGSWLSTDGRLPPGLMRLAPRPRRRGAPEAPPLEPLVARPR